MDDGAKGGGERGAGQGGSAVAARRRDALERRGPRPVAALDLGTNNCRLLVAEPEGAGFRVLDAFSRAVLLGQGVQGTNRLCEAAQERAIRALRICAGKIPHHRVEAMRVIATEACRRADNGPDFAERVQRETGLRIEIISPAEEARLAVAGCAPLVDPEAEQLLVFDIGGGSTELIWVDLSRTAPAARRTLVRRLAPLGGDRGDPAVMDRVTDWISVPMGVTTLHERFADRTCPRARLAAMSAAFEDALAGFLPYRAPDRGALARRLQIIGVSGTATSFGALHLGLKAYDRTRVDGLWLPAADARRIAAGLAEAAAPRGVRQRGDGQQGDGQQGDGQLGDGPPGSGPPGSSLDGAAAHGPSPQGGQQNGTGLHGPGRSDLVLAGAAILTTILACWPVDQMRIADRGLREGLLYSLLRRQGQVLR